MKEQVFDIQAELKKLPAKPGVYLMYDENDHVIYVGKAIKLRNRVRQYFQSTSKGPKIDQMVRHIRRFEYIVTESELEALALECNLIKEHHPKYNTMLMDDKTYPYIKVTVEEAYPRVFLTRRLTRDGSRYFGPYTDVGAARAVIDLVMKLYQIRRCRRVLPRDIGKERACLQYDIGQCAAPCQGLISQKEYREHVDQVLQFLSGHYKPVRDGLKKRMQAYADALEYEKAAGCRELLEQLETVAQTQRVTSGKDNDLDVIALARREEDALVQVFFVRGGRLIGRDHFYLQTGTEIGSEAAAESGEQTGSGQILADFIQQFYGGTATIPAQLLLSEPVEDAELLAAWLGEKRGQKVTITTPIKGGKEHLVKMALENAAMTLEKDAQRLKQERARTVGAVEEIRELLGLPVLTRIEAYDISNISGFASVGSMVVFENGRPKTNDYRKFRIKGVQGADDYASLAEVLRRRLTHGLEESGYGTAGQGDEKDLSVRKEGRGFARFPDLIMMDGGKGQVGVARKVLNELGLAIPVSGMVKDDRHRTRGLYYENQLIPIATDSEGFKLITRVQDEAHRFAITYHRSLRSKGQVHSVLDDIPQIGAARRKALMKAFTGLDEIRQATTEELAALPSMNAAAAQAVFEFFHTETGEK